MVKEEKGRKYIVPYSPKQEKGIEIYRFPGAIVEEMKDSYVARVHLKQEARKDFKYNVGKNSLELKIGKKVEKEEKGKFRYYYERQEREFSSTIRLDRQVDVKNVREEYTGDILTITIPKKN